MFDVSKRNLQDTPEDEGKDEEEKVMAYDESNQKLSYNGGAIESGYLGKEAGGQEIFRQPFGKFGKPFEEPPQPLGVGLNR